MAVAEDDTNPQNQEFVEIGERMHVSQKDCLPRCNFTHVFKCKILDSTPGID